MQMDDRSKLLRRYVIDAMRGGGRGHLGSSMSMIEMLRSEERCGGKGGGNNCIKRKRGWTYG